MDIKVKIEGAPCLADAPPFVPLEVAQVVRFDDTTQTLTTVLHRVHCPEYRSSIPQVRR